MAKDSNTECPHALIINFKLKLKVTYSLTLQVIDAL